MNERLYNIRMGDVALRPMTRDEYHLAIDAGVYPDYRYLELIKGQVTKRMTHTPPRAKTVRKLTKWLDGTVPGDCIVSAQFPIALDSLSEPEPDIAIAQGTEDDFGFEHPRPDQTRLIVEVADSSLHQDLNVKLPLYATAGIPEFWVVDLKGQRILVHREPIEDRYRSVSEFGIDGVIEASWCPGATLAVRDLLP
jgi:Uma2 family endonuclease